MIIYDLCCENGHHFEGWFQSAADFESQQNRHLVCCPQCNTDVLRRIPSAVAIGKHRTEEVHSKPSSTTGGAMLPAGTQVTEIYRQMIHAMVSNCEDVGGSFAEEARKIHYKEVPERSIRGEASEDEINELHDEGIPILRVAGIKKEDLVH